MYDAIVVGARCARAPTQQLFGAPRHNLAQIDRLRGTFIGTVSPQEFFAPENLGQIMAMAA